MGAIGLHACHPRFQTRVVLARASAVSAIQTLRAPPVYPFQHYGSQHHVTTRRHPLRGTSRTEVDYQLAREYAVTARLSRNAADAVGAPGATRDLMPHATAPDDIRTYPCGEVPAATAVAVLAERHSSESAAAPGGDEALVNRRVLLEQGDGSDYAEPYTFDLPLSVKQMLTWARLLARFQRGELES